MSPADGTRVRPDDLLAHAGHVDAVADSVATGQQAGNTVRVDVGAYGRLCTIVPILLGYLQDAVLDGLATAVDSLHGTGEQVRAAANAYQSTDAASAADIHRASGPR